MVARIIWSLLGLIVGLALCFMAISSGYMFGEDYATKFTTGEFQAVFIFAIGFGLCGTVFILNYKAYLNYKMKKTLVRNARVKQFENHCRHTGTK